VTALVNGASRPVHTCRPAEEILVLHFGGAIRWRMLSNVLQLALDSHHTATEWCGGFPRSAGAGCILLHGTGHTGDRGHFGYQGLGLRFRFLFVAAFRFRLTAGLLAGHSVRNSSPRFLLRAIQTWSSVENCTCNMVSRNFECAGLAHMFFEGSFQPTPKVLLILIVRSVNYIPKVTEREMQSENEIMIIISNCPRPQKC